MRVEGSQSANWARVADHGQKVGWQGQDLPPGQARKQAAAAPVVAEAPPAAAPVVAETPPAAAPVVAEAPAAAAPVVAEPPSMIPADATIPGLPETPQLDVLAY